MIAAASVASARAPTPTWGDAPVEWAGVAVVTQGQRVIEESRVWRVSAAPGATFALRNLTTRIRVEGPEGVTDYDSTSPGDADPWPLVLQHVVSTAPATLRWDAGQVALTDPATWRDTAQDALLAASLPPAVLASSEGLLDAPTFEEDLRRWFPGPLVGDRLERAEHLAGVDTRRVETCAEERAAGRTRWRCEGTASDPDGRLRDAHTWTVLEADRHGLLAVESGYDGVLDLRDQGRGLLVVAGRRRAERRELP